MKGSLKLRKCHWLSGSSVCAESLSVGCSAASSGTLKAKADAPIKKTLRAIGPSTIPVFLHLLAIRWTVIEGMEVFHDP